jgi:hypothetical protein
MDRNTSGCTATSAGGVREMEEEAQAGMGRVGSVKQSERLNSRLTGWV